MSADQLPPNGPDRSDGQGGGVGQVVIVRGLPGVGKTTTAALLRDRLTPAVRVGIDTIRYLAQPRGLDASSIRKAELASVALARSYALQGVNAVIEGVILDTSVLETMIGSCRVAGLPVTVVNMQASLPRLLERNRQREPYDRVADDRIRMLDARFSATIGVTVSSDGRVAEEVTDCILYLLGTPTPTATPVDDWRLFFIRHGAARVDDNHYPSHDTMPLSDEGNSQVLACRDTLRMLGIERIVTSPFARCTETAEIINHALQAPMDIDERLKERSFPAFYGKPYHEIAGQIGMEAVGHLRSNSDLVTVPGTEDVAALGARTLDAVIDIQASPARRTLVVSHGGPHGWLCAHALGLSGGSTARRFPLGHARLSAFTTGDEPGGLRLISLNTNAESLLTPGIT